MENTGQIGAPSACLWNLIIHLGISPESLKLIMAAITVLNKYFI